MAEVFKVPAPVTETKRRLKRPASPQPSTSSSSSSSSLSSAPELSTAELARKHIMQSVYAHLNESIHINDIGQLRGLRTSRRHGRRRGLQPAGLPVRVSDAIKLIEPLLLSEIMIQQSQHVLVSSALDHFANVINHIVDQAEESNDPLKSSASFSKRKELKRMFAELADDQTMIDVKGRSMNLLSRDDEEDKDKDISPQVKTAAAVVAIVLGEKNRDEGDIDVTN